MADKWYHSGISNGVGTAAIILAGGFGLAAIVKSCDVSTTSEIERERIKRTYQIQTADLNGNGIPEKFYAIDGRVALVELDGKPVSELYKR